MKNLKKTDFNLRCGICKYKFNALNRNSWNYDYDSRFKEIVKCSDRCQLIFSASNPTAKNSDEIKLLVN